LRFCDS